jgi:hypothetical protein
MGKVSLERVQNGYIIRHEAEDQTLVVADNNDVEAAWQMLCAVNDLIGHPGSRHDRERVRVIVLPGNKGLPAEPGGCLHTWVERHQWGEDPPTWWCPCGATFALVKAGGSWADEFEASRREEEGP